jgi:hypothetical protein
VRDAIRAFNKNGKLGACRLSRLCGCEVGRPIYLPGTGMAGAAGRGVDSGAGLEPSRTE